jgi:hypothetical protein
VISWLASSTWAYPALEVVHIVGIGLLIGNLLLLELRVFGYGAALPIEALARLSLGIALVGFVLAAVSGLLMFATRPLELIANRTFVIKMTLLMCAAGNAAWFHSRGSLTRFDATARAQMLFSSIIWLAVIACGRWIAYK